MKKALFPFLLFFLSCDYHSRTADYGETFQKIIKPDDGIFRGVLLGDLFEKIRSSENGTLLEQDSSYLFYEYKLDSSDTYTVEYQFENKKLSEIRLDVYIKDVRNWKILFENLKEYFNEKYGNCTSENESFIWRTNAGSIQIVLTDESADYDEGILSLEFFYTSFPA